MIPFEASGPTITVDFSSTDNCGNGTQGFDVGILEVCGDVCIEGDSNCGSPTDPISFSYDGLNVGQVYIVFIDHCGASSGIFDISIDVSDTTEPAEVVIEYEIYSTTVCELSLCSNEGVQVYFNSSIEGLLSSDREVHLQVSGPTNFSIVEEVSNPLVLSAEDYNFEEGEYEICVTKIVTECNEILVVDCGYFTIDDSESVTTVLDVCIGELNDGFGEEFLGYNVYNDGTYLSELEFCECGDQFFTINEKEEEEELVILQLCPEDFPFLYFDEYEFEYSENGYELALIVENGSLQIDYDGEACDSLVYIVIENMPCGGCDLPVSLLDSELVICLPFEDNAFDVSGNNNVVNAFNLDYEDFTVDGKVTYSADFNGRSDYVEIPYTDLLDSPVFSFSFEFDKYKGFRNGAVETLISMGSDNQNRLKVDLVQTVSDSFDMVGTFFTETGEVSISAEGLDIDIEYDMAIVVNGNVIQMYLDGEIVDEVLMASPLYIGEDDILLGVESAEPDMSQFYEGYVNDFKYWAQTLGGRDVLFLHDPEAEFLESIDVPLTCCEQVMINDSMLISFESPIQTIVVPEASETGYDSTYIFNFVADDPAPIISQALLPQDIMVDYQKQCDEFCSQIVTWDITPQNIFSDNCPGLTFEQSHYSPIQIDQDNPQIEVTYTAIDVCGSRSEFSFMVELNCVEPEQTAIAEDNAIQVQIGNVCVDSNNSICINSEVDIIPTYLDQNFNTVMYNNLDHGALEFEFSINGQSQNFAFTGQTGFQPNFPNAGSYEVCLETISDECVTRYVGSCETFNVYESQSKNYGVYTACSDDHQSVLPTEASEELRNTVNNQQSNYTYNGTDACGCGYIETIQINNVSTGMPELLTIELCEGERFDIMGRTFDGTIEYNSELIVFPNATMQTNSSGERCDSLIELTLVKLEESYTEQSVSICDGEEYEGNTESGAYQMVIASGAANGCDSTFVLNLSVVPITMTEIAQSICEGEAYMGYDEAGNYEDTYSATSGCDSIVSLSLTVRPTSQVEFSEVICEGNVFMGYSETGIYQDVYTNAVGCDSIVSLDLTVLDPDDPQCIGTSSSDLGKSSMLIFPNPTTNYLYVQNRNNDIVEVTNFSLYSKDGKRVMAVRDLYDNRFDVSELYSGVYFLHVVSGENELWHKFLKF